MKDLKKIKKDFNELRHRFSKPEIKEIRKILYEIENKKNLSKSKAKRIENNFLELEKSISGFKKHKNGDYDDPEYRNLKTQEIYLTSQLRKIIKCQKKPKVLLTVNMVNMKAKGTKIKIYHLKNILI